MSFLVKKIVNHIREEIEKQKHENTEAYYVNKERIVLIQGVVLKIQLPLNYFKDIQANKDVTPK